MSSHPRPIVTRPAAIPLSPPQQRLWFLWRLNPASHVYHIPLAWRCDGRLDRGALHAALNDVIERHEVLRTVYRENDGLPLQDVRDDLELALEVVASGPAAVETDIEAAIQAPFDLRAAPPIRARLLVLGHECHVLVLVIHHIASDGWSCGVLSRDLTTAYAARSAGRPPAWTPLPLQYADYALEQQQALERGAMRDGLEYWRRQLSVASAVLELPIDRPRTRGVAYTTRLWRASVSPHDFTALKARCRAHRTTLYVSLLSAFGILLAQYSRQDDICIGTPVANRHDEATREMVGCCVNTVAMRVRIDNDASVGQLLNAVHRTAVDAHEHRAVPFEWIVESLAPTRNLLVNPLFQVILALQNVPAAPLALSGLSVSPVPRTTYSAKVDLEVHAYEADARLHLLWLYNAALFDEWRIEQMADHYVQALCAIARDDSQRIGRIELLNDNERRRMLSEWA